MRFVAALTALVVGAGAAPQRPEWHWGDHSPPGWPHHSVYTPRGPPRPKWSHPWTSYGSTATSTPAPYPTGTATGASSLQPTNSANSTGTGACGSVSKLVASFTHASPSSSATPTVPAELAYDCITSVPFNSSAAVALLDSIRPYVDWQTTLQYIKDPPAEYAEKIQPPYDFMANFERIYNSAKANSYASEYAFGFDLYRLFQITHDGHFRFVPDSVGLIFNFGRTTPLVSVSLDGTSIPEVYVYADILASAFGNTSFTPSPLAQIDGQDSTEWLLNYSQYGSLQDRDALWNNVFYILAQVSLGPSGTGTGTFSGGGRGRWVYPGPSTTLTFKNGTSTTNQNYAQVLVPFDGINNGEQLYQMYFVPPSGQPEPAGELATMTAASSSVPAATSSASTTIPAPGYPSPVIREMNNLNSGYFLEGEGYDDVAVLSVPSFVGSGADEIDFQMVNTYLINQAVAHGKKKLIVDVSANAGGTILQGYDLFKQLFPQILPYGATRFRAHEAFDIIGQEVSYYSGLVPRSLDTNDTVQEIVSTPWNYRTDADINYEPFPDWPTKFGPHQYGPEMDNYTSIIRWNLSDVLTPDNSGGIYVSGYLNRSNITTEPFAAENIVIVYDGYCASTCTIFSELMRQQGNVKTIALGGRPNKDIIQAVGGVKGTNDLTFDDILFGVELPFLIEHYHDAEYYNSTVLGQYSDLPLYRSIDTAVNARDGIRQGDKTGTPLQFVYEPADCRIYYTPEMVVDETAVWKTVADTAFRGINHCVAGSYPSSGGSNATKRSTAPRRHAIRRDMDVKEHLQALSEVWTGKNGVVGRGDCVMLP